MGDRLGFGCMGNFSKYVEKEEQFHAKSYCLGRGWSATCSRQWLPHPPGRRCNLIQYCQGSLREELGHLTAGLSKLEEASSTVDDLSKNAEKKKKELQTAQVREGRI